MHKIRWNVDAWCSILIRGIHASHPAGVLCTPNRTVLPDCGKATEKNIKAYARRVGELLSAKLLTRLLACHKAKSLLNDEQREKQKTMHCGGRSCRGKK